jgi:hypothetical protein
MRLNLLLLFAFAIWSGNAASQRSGSETIVFKPASVSTPDEKTVMIDGVLLPGVEKEFFSALTSKTETVVIRSEGGATTTALDIAEVVQQKGLNVTVHDYCISSCANYIFIAGKLKNVLPNSLLAWHGGHSDAPYAGCRLIEDKCEVPKWRIRSLKREQSLYLRTQTSLDLILFSGLITRGTKTESTQEPSAQGSSPVIQRQFWNWSPSKVELERLGVKGIQGFWHAKSQNEVQALLVKFGFPANPVFLGNAYSIVPEVIDQ